MQEVHHRKLNVVIELRSEVPGYQADAPIMVTVPENYSLREAAISAIRSSNLNDETRRFLEEILLGRTTKRDVAVQPHVITQGGTEEAVGLERQVGEVVRTTGSNRIVFHVAPVVG